MHKSRDNSQALAIFIVRKGEFDAILARLTALSAEHVGREPDAVAWSDVGTLANYLKGLREISDAAVHEGEHAV
jgi:hypothetical protein